MILRQFLVPETACASYLFGCTTHGKLAVVDPHASLVEEYLSAAEQIGPRLINRLANPLALIGIHLRIEQIRQGFHLRRSGNRPAAGVVGLDQDQCAVGAAIHQLAHVGIKPTGGHQNDSRWKPRSIADQFVHRLLHILLRKRLGRFSLQQFAPRRKTNHLQFPHHLFENQKRRARKRHRQLLPQRHLRLKLAVGNAHIAHQALQIYLAVLLAHIAAKRGHRAAAAGGVDAQTIVAQQPLDMLDEPALALAMNEWIGRIPHGLIALFSLAPAL